MPRSVTLFTNTTSIYDAILDGKDGEGIIKLQFNDDNKLTIIDSPRKSYIWRQYVNSEFLEHIDYYEPFGIIDREEIILYRGNIAISMPDNYNINPSGKPIYRRISGNEEFSISRYAIDGNILKFEWKIDGRLSRPIEIGPAQIYFTKEGECISYTYLVDGNTSYHSIKPGHVDFLLKEKTWFLGDEKVIRKYNSGSYIEKDIIKMAI